GWGVVEKYRGESEVQERPSPEKHSSYLPRLVTPATDVTAVPSPTSSKPATANPAARSQRRKSLKPSATTDFPSADHRAEIKRLEDELFGSLQALEGCRAELEEAREKVGEWEGVVEKKEGLILRLESVNKELIVENDAIKDELDRLRGEVEAYFDAKAEALVDVEVQTEHLGGEEDQSREATSDDGRQEEYPVHLSHSVDGHANNDGEDLDNENEDRNERNGMSRPESVMSQKLDHANKARVELVKELAKSHKAAEKMKQHYEDIVQRLKREVEGWEREVKRVKGEAGEKEVAKDKLKEEYERKLRNSEGQISKLKQKHKESEKLVGAKEALERRATDLQAEVEKLSGVVSGLKKKMKEDADKSNELDSRRVKEIQAMRKQHEEDLKK
ncbi:hypothetical protein HK097_005840, partial [Rhizophlyctis rosea]